MSSKPNKRAQRAKKVKKSGGGNSQMAPFYLVAYGPGTNRAFQAAAEREGISHKEITDAVCDLFRVNSNGKLDARAIIPQVRDPDDKNFAVQLMFMGSSDMIVCTMCDLRTADYGPADLDEMVNATTRYMDAVQQVAA
jgi:hypothetical protein